MKHKSLRVWAEELQCSTCTVSRRQKEGKEAFELFLRKQQFRISRGMSVIEAVYCIDDKLYSKDDLMVLTNAAESTLEQRLAKYLNSKEEAHKILKPVRKNGNRQGEPMFELGEMQERKRVEEITQLGTWEREQFEKGASNDVADACLPCASKCPSFLGGSSRRY